ncbi:hypothetical protein LZ554_005763 [Drepanopeziza brunnea f. sp. 'monogermtubi']|nr:hypothetical protein LZ554_005763 [Drepanopeziza brunnea f. sp. 'monogermtubi']
MATNSVSHSPVQSTKIESTDPNLLVHNGNLTTMAGVDSIQRQLTTPEGTGTSIPQVDIRPSKAKPPKAFYWNGLHPSQLAAGDRWKNRKLCTYCNYPLFPANFGRIPRICGGCEQVTYCSMKCQLADERLHQIVCELFTTFIRTSPRPSSAHKITLLIPADSDVPVFLWLRYTQYHHFDVPDLETVLGDDYPAAMEDSILHRLHISHMYMQPFDLDHQVYYWYRDGCKEDGSVVNQCLATITKVPMDEMTFKGPLLIASSAATHWSARGGYRDFGLEDFRVVYDYFRIYHSDSQKPPGIRYSVGEGKPVMGVRLTCLGDQRLFKDDAYVPVKLPLSHSIYRPELYHDREVTLAVPNLLGLPLLFDRHLSEYDNLSEAETRQMSEDREYFENRQFLPLTVDVDPYSPGWGNVDRRDNGRFTYSVSLVRADKKDLTIFHAQAIIAFCSGFLIPAMQRQHKHLADSGMSSREMVAFRESFKREMICRARFEKWLATYRDQKALAFPVLALELSPYEV